MIILVMAISNLVLTQQIYSEETSGAHAHNPDRVPLKCYHDFRLPFFFARLAVQYLKYMVWKLQLHTIKESGIFWRSKTINFRPSLQRYVPVAWLPRTQVNLLCDVIYLTQYTQRDNFLQRTLLKNVPFPATSMCSCLGKLFPSYYIRLGMCAATASIDRIELQASLTS